MNCPKCDSDNTRKFSIIYEEGTSRGKSEGFSDHSNYETEHFSQTPLAKRCSPPKEPEISSFLVLIGIAFSIFIAFKLGVFAGSFWWGVGAFVLSLVAFNILWHFTLGSKKNKQYDLDYETWDNSWICMKCGNDFLSSK